MLYVLTWHIIFTITLWYRWHCYPLFTSEETKTQRDLKNCPSWYYHHILGIYTCHSPVAQDDKALYVIQEKGMANHFSILALRTPWTIMKRQKYRTLKDELPRLVAPNMLLEISGEITPERKKRRSQSNNTTQLRMWLVIEVKSNAVKSNIA